LDILPWLNELKSNSVAGIDFQSLRLLVLNVLYPGIGVSYALAKTDSPPFHSALVTPLSS
jgi:hypothetical protein